MPYADAMSQRCRVVHLVTRWAALGACLLLAAIWVVSVRFKCAVGTMTATRSIELWLDSGELWWHEIEAIPPQRLVLPHLTGFWWGRTQTQWRWWFSVSRTEFGAFRYRDIRVPLWVPMLLVTIPTAWLWRRDL